MSQLFFAADSDGGDPDEEGLELELELELGSGGTFESLQDGPREKSSREWWSEWARWKSGRL